MAQVSWVLGCVVELEDSGGSGRDGGMLFWGHSMDPTALLPPPCVSVLDVREGSLGLAPCVRAVLPYGSVASASGCCSVSGICSCVPGCPKLSFPGVSKDHF